MRVGMRLALGVATLMCVATSRRAATQETSGVARADSAAILREAWTVVSPGQARLRSVWFWIPASAVTPRVLPISAELRSLLADAGIPASERLPKGDDTVVFRVAAWHSDSGGALLDFQSHWTTVLGRGCRAASGNVEKVRVHRTNGAWIAARVGSILHGDRVCR